MRACSGHQTQVFSVLLAFLSLSGPALRAGGEINASQGFRSFWAAWRTLAGYEVIHMIRKGQACGSAPTRVGLLHRFIVGMFGIEV
jgi:hypothetical protein